MLNTIILLSCKKNIINCNHKIKNVFTYYYFIFPKLVMDVTIELRTTDNVFSDTCLTSNIIQSVENL